MQPKQNTVTFPGRSIALIAWITIALMASCVPNGPPATGPAPVAVKPMCTVQLEALDTHFISWNGRIFTADRDDPSVAGNFAPFHAAKGPIGNPEIPFTNQSGIPDTYGISEAWLSPFNNEVHRVLLTPALGTGLHVEDPVGASWAFYVQDATGSWKSEGSRTKVSDLWDPINDRVRPKLMAVGESEPHIFACVPGRTQDGAETTTLLMESQSPQSSSASPQLIQDLLNGDDRGPASPPTPSVHGPGDPIHTGLVTCAMTQAADDISTRTLHMLMVKDGKILHAAASDFGPVNKADGSSFSRFRKVSPWGDVLAVLGGDYGEIGSLAVVGSNNFLNVFFVGKKGGGFADQNATFKLWHVVRFSSGDWRAPVDVFARSGDAPSGMQRDKNSDLEIGAGACPAFGTDNPQGELLIALGGDVMGGIYTISFRNNATSSQPSGYSHWYLIQNGEYDPSHFLVLGMEVSARPFSDTAKP